MNRALTICGVIALAMGADAIARGAGQSRFQVWNQGDLKFTESAKGIERAKAWGDPDKGDFGMIIRYQAGAERGWHSHSSPIHLVMISGTLVFEGEGSPARELGPGSGVTEPPNVKHNSRCKEGADCLFLITGPRKYDYKAATEAAVNK